MKILLNVVISVSKEHDDLNPCDHLWQVTGCLFNDRQLATGMRCTECGRVITRPFDEERRVFGDWEIVEEGRVIKSDS